MIHNLWIPKLKNDWVKYGRVKSGLGQKWPGQKWTGSKMAGSKTARSKMAWVKNGHIPSESFRLVVPTYILEEFNTIPSPVFSQIKRVLLLQSGQWPICPGTLLLLIFKRVENDGRPPKESWGREVDSCLNEAISQNHHLYSSSPAFSSKILIWKQCVFEYSIVHKTLRMVGLLLVVLKLVARQNPPFIG